MPSSPLVAEHVDSLAPTANEAHNTRGLVAGQCRTEGSPPWPLAVTTGRGSASCYKVMLQLVVPKFSTHPVGLS